MVKKKEDWLEHNGLSPLNLAGILTNAISWIRFAQRTENS
jgi:hypothetical protein